VKIDLTGDTAIAVSHMAVTVTKIIMLIIIIIIMLIIIIITVIISSHHLAVTILC